MEHSVHVATVSHYRKLIAVSEADPSRDESRHQTLLRLLAEERAKDPGPEDWPNA